MTAVCSEVLTGVGFVLFLCIVLLKKLFAARCNTSKYCHAMNFIANSLFGITWIDRLSTAKHCGPQAYQRGDGVGKRLMRATVNIEIPNQLFMVFTHLCG